MAAEMKGLELRLRVPLPSVGVGRVALGALRPDLAPPPTPGKGPPRPHPPPELQLRGEELLARWEAPGARGLRGGVTSFLELLGLVLETIERFGPSPPDPSPTPRPSPTPPAPPPQ